MTRCKIKIKTKSITIYSCNVNNKHMHHIHSPIGSEGGMIDYAESCFMLNDLGRESTMGLM